jgi:putative FmdB family regulatory protein
MPTYEYACSACGNQWEQVQRIVEAPIEVCPKCAQSAAHRLISGGTNFILKGGGWYSDLYSSAKNKGSSESNTAATAAKSDGASSSSSSDAGGSSGGSESKPAAPATPAASTPSTTT